MANISHQTICVWYPHHIVYTKGTWRCQSRSFHLYLDFLISFVYRLLVGPCSLAFNLFSALRDRTALWTTETWLLAQVCHSFTNAIASTGSTAALPIGGARSASSTTWGGGGIGSLRRVCSGVGIMGLSPSQWVNGSANYSATPAREESFLAIGHIMSIVHTSLNIYLVW